MKTNKLWMADYSTGDVCEAQYPQLYDRGVTAILTDYRPTDEQAAAACAAGTGHPEPQLWAVGTIDRQQRPLTEAAKDETGKFYSVFSRRLTDRELGYLRGDMLEGVTAVLGGVKIYISIAYYQRQY